MQIKNLNQSVDSLNTVNKNVSNLAKAKILLRVNKGSYILNPRYFARGTMTSKTRMELIVKYDG